MTEDIDDAIEVAARRTREAEERLRHEPIESPELVVDAHVVHRRTEDLHDLASDAASETDAGA